MINTIFHPTEPSEPLKRVPMPEGTTIPIAGTDILISRDGKESDHSSGSTCLVYRGHIASGTGIVTGTHVIIKEFYPSPGISSTVLTRMPDGSLQVSGSDLEDNSFAKSREQFLQGLKYQKELAGSNAMEISIRPLFVSSWGDSVYIISDAHRGSDLGARPPASLREAVSLAVSISETMGILHDNGYIMTDIKADNYLWIRKPNSVRIIDTDSLVPFRDPVRMEQKPLFANNNHRSPEIEFLEIKMREHTAERELKILKKAMLTPLADLYSEGIFFFELFFRRLPDFSDFDSYLRDCSRADIDGRQKLLDELTGLYGPEIRRAGKNTSQLLGAILAILQKLLIRNPGERRTRGYKTESAIISDFQEILAQLSSEKIVLKREVASANARFTAYNLLQKYPLFDYTVPSHIPEPQLRVFSGQGKTAGHADRYTPAEELRVAIIGGHAMRTDLLSAVLSIGQMPDTPLVVELISDDADIFWKEYTSKDRNPALSRAVTWEFAGGIGQVPCGHPVNSGGLIRVPDGETVPSGRTVRPGDGHDRKTDGSLPGEFDPSLVSRPLAHLIISSQDRPDLAASDADQSTVYRPSANYFIILEENPEKRDAWIKYASCRSTETRQRMDTPGISETGVAVVSETTKTFIGYLRFENEETLPGHRHMTGGLLKTVSTDLKEVHSFTHKEIPREGRSAAVSPCVLYAISAKAFTEEYSEKMFSEKIYHMGLMAHAYYCNALDSDDEIDMEALERDFRGNLYNVTSSERCALHGLYKMAGIGIDWKRPGHFRKFNRMIRDDAALEMLAWLEHLSWTAYMLTSGAVPVSMEEFGSYAYIGSNDWKDRSDSGHLRHPLLAASGYDVEHTLKEIESPDEITPEFYAQLDPLDRVSVGITRWYTENRERTRTRYLQWIDTLITCTERKDNSEETVFHPGKKQISKNGILISQQERKETDSAAVLPEAVSSETVSPEAVSPETVSPEDRDDLFTLLRKTGLECIELMGTSLPIQNPPAKTEWNTFMNTLRDLYSGRDDVQQLLLEAERTIMKPVFHSFENRDFKQNDRELTYAVIDMIT